MTSLTCPEQILITYQQRSYILKRLPQEPITFTYQRLWKIIQHHPQNDIEFDKLVNLSQIWAYHYLFGCQYNQTIETKLKSF